METVFDRTWGVLPAPMRDQLSGYGQAFWSALPQIILALLFPGIVWIVVAVASRWVPQGRRVGAPS